MFRNGLLTSTAMTAVAFLLSGAPADAKGTITTFNVDGSSATEAIAINARGVITGHFVDTVGNDVGFVRAPDGTITTFSAEGSSYTWPTCINRQGFIAGHYAAPSGRDKFGFVRRANGEIKRFHVPGGSHRTYPSVINDSMTIAGFYDGRHGLSHSFVRSAGGTTITFDPVGAEASVVNGINANGDVTGSYEDSAGIHGFVRTADGTITSFDPTGSQRTFSYAINGSNVIAGYFINGSGTTSSFVRASDGTITTFDQPGSLGTKAYAINAKGAITGYYFDDLMQPHGFVRTPDGKMISFDPPKSTGTEAFEHQRQGRDHGLVQRQPQHRRLHPHAVSPLRRAGWREFIRRPLQGGMQTCSGTVFCFRRR